MPRLSLCDAQAYLTNVERDLARETEHPDYSPDVHNAQTWRVWMLEALVEGLREYVQALADGTERGKLRRPDRMRVMARCALQQRQMLGRMGGFYSGLPHTHDAAIALQHVLEDLVTEAATSEALSWPRMIGGVS